MGAKSRERRRARQRAQAEAKRRWMHGESAGAGARSGPGRPQHSAAELAESLVISAVHAHLRQDLGEAARLHLLLVDGLHPPGHDRAVDQAMLRWLQRSVEALWSRGWQPADVQRMAERRLGAQPAALAVDMIAAQMRQYAAATVDERWEAQVTALGATPWWGRDDHYFALWGGRQGLGREAMVGQAIELIALLQSLPRLPELCPPPGAARRVASTAGRRGGPAPDQRVLDRVRALLAKAESTVFEEEAEALTAKAQELIARHSIDHALLAAVRGGGADEPIGVRVGVDRPYESPKAMLLQQVARANRCQAAWSKNFGFSTVFGFASDLQAVELLYTSLLVQGTTALVHEGSRQDGRGQSRTRSFRQSFLTAYAIRIGERLRAATEQASSEAMAESGDRNLLPVLAARDDAVKQAAETALGGVINREVRISDAEGWTSGTAAADRASLEFRRAVNG